MSTPSLQDKTIRPGKFTGFSYYHSDRHPGGLTTPIPSKHHYKLWTSLAVLLLLVMATFLFTTNASAPKFTKSSLTPLVATVKTTTPIVKPSTPAVNPCANNRLSQEVLVSVSARHLWACQNTKTIFDSPVVTGMTMYPDTITPTGTYYIYAKETNTTLTGSDSTGSWNDPVSYWMPFLNNQYGTYGLHDASWRANSAFGNISPNSNDASHGCVEMPQATAKWLYNWVQVGTAVAIEN